MSMSFGSILPSQSQDTEDCDAADDDIDEDDDVMGTVDAGGEI
jgi:hypothetical protein